VSRRSILAIASAAWMFGALPVAKGQAVVHDSVVRRPQFINRRQTIVALSSILATAAVAPFDRKLEADLQRPRLQDNHGLQAIARGLSYVGGPGTFIVGGGLYVAGTLARTPHVAGAGIDVIESVLLAGTVTAIGKGLFGRTIPRVNEKDADNFEFFRGFQVNNGRYVSFPSGHAAAAFALASAMTSELRLYQPGIVHIAAPAMYAGATLIGLARMYQNVHWASDLPIAAAIGAWSGSTVVALRHSSTDPHAGRSAHDVLSSLTIMPAGGGRIAFGVSLPLDAAGDMR
jgi:membrane-associated phospholipid phosphatase